MRPAALTLRVNDASAAEAIEDLVLRTALDDHDAIMAETQETLRRCHLSQPLVYKTHVTPPRDAGALSDGNDLSDYASDLEPPPFTDFQMDVIAEVLAETRMEFQSEIDALTDVLNAVKQRVAMVEGQLSVVVAMIGNDNGRGVKTIEAEESKIIRKMKVS
jgi:hypothetical protein